MLMIKSRPPAPSQYHWAASSDLCCFVCSNKNALKKNYDVAGVPFHSFLDWRRGPCCFDSLGVKGISAQSSFSVGRCLYSKWTWTDSRLRLEAWWISQISTSSQVSSGTRQHLSQQSSLSVSPTRQRPPDFHTAEVPNVVSFEPSGDQTKQFFFVASSLTPHFYPRCA